MWNFLRGSKRHQRAAERSEAARSERAAQEPAPQDGSVGPGPQGHPAPERTAPESTGARRSREAAPQVDFTVDPRGGTGAGVAPEQDEDDLPAVTREHRPLSREDLVQDALQQWAHDITGGTSTPSFLTHMRAGATVLDLTHSHPSGLAQLLANRGPTRLSSLVREVGALADARAHARAIREVAERHAEEVGLTTCHLGIGEATWEPEDGSAPMHAPVLVRPITLRLRGNAREDVDLDLDATADLNPVLLRALREAGVAVDARALLSTTDGPHGFDPTPVLDAFRSLGEPLPGFRISHALVIGNLMDAAGTIAADLDEDPDDFSAHPVVAALAGAADAREELTAAAAKDITAESVPEDELVAAVDPDHRAVLARVLDGQNVVATTVPGSDGLDLVVDLAAELTARGRSVLVVSQRRRNLGRLVELAEQRGLGELVFDLSPDPALQRNASAALLRSLRRAGSHGIGPDAEEPEALAQAREILAGHVEAMHRTQQPWGVSAHEAISALAALTRRRPAPLTTVRLRAEVAASMIGGERDRFADLLREAADVGVLSAGPEQSAWYGAPISSDTQAQRARELVAQLREDALPRMQRAIDATGPQIGLRPVDTLEGLIARLDLLDQVREVLGEFQPAAFRAELSDLVAATADKQWRAEHGVTMGWGVRRRLVKQAHALQRPTAVVPDLHAGLVQLRRILAQWRAVALEKDSVPTLPQNLDAARRAAADTQHALDEFGLLAEGSAAGGDLPRTELEELQRLLHALDADIEDLQELPRRTTLLRRLDFDGLGELVEDLRARRVGREDVGAELDLAWWRSVLELIAGAEPTISQYDGTSLSQVAERFRRLDAAYLAEAAPRIHAAADEVLVETMKTYPDTSRAAIAELARSSTVSVRDLAAKYEDILFQARPIWLASPFLVPQVMPRGRHIDVVIIADGGRLPTAAALPSIVRASQTVVVGDVLEYGGDAPGLVDDLLPIASHVELLHDSQPASEGLRRFAQRRALVGPVRAMPGPVATEPDRLIHVENGRGSVIEGAQYVESTEAELRRVTDLVIDHARTRPERSLAVFALTETHARRLMERIMQTVAVIPSLRPFFDPSVAEFFTVAPAAHASTIVRDDVIVSIGFGRTPHDRMLHNFGPLSGPQGRKALATVLTRARGRTTVVSAISIDDLDPARLRTEGAQDLRALLWVLRGGSDVPVTPQVELLRGGESAEPEAAILPETADPSEEPADGAGTTPPGEEEPEGLSDEDLDAAIEAALARKAAEAAGESLEDDEGPAETDEPAEEDVSRADGAPSDGDIPSAADHAAGAQAPGGDEAEAVETGAPDEEPAGDGPAEATAPSAAELLAPGEEPAPRRELETDALVRDLADRLTRLGLLVEKDFGLDEDRIELAIGHPELPGRYLLAVDTDGDRYVATRSQRERDRLRAEWLEAVGWVTERVWSWALFIDPDGEAERIRRAVERALMLARSDDAESARSGAGTIRHRLPRPQIPAGHPLSFYSSEDFDAVVEYICSDGRARLEDQLATEVRSFLGFEKRSVLLDVSVSSAIRRYQERQ